MNSTNHTARNPAVAGHNLNGAFSLAVGLVIAGLWRFSLKLSPLEIADLGKQELRTLLNTAQDCAIYLKNQGQNKKKKG